jgi:1,4-dihydroxy-2-naphthoyl-CoA hydrolase
MDLKACQDMLELMPFAKLLGIKVISVSKTELRATLSWREDITTTGGIIHGGALMSYGDAVGALLAFMNLPDGAGTTTIESKTNFLRAAVEGSNVNAVCKPLSVGRQFIVVQTDLYNDKSQRLAQVTQTQAVLGPSKI